MGKNLHKVRPQKVQVTLDKTRTLVYDLNAFAELEEQFGSIQQGMIELSNVKLVNEMVDLITAQRAYEANSKAITTTDSMLDTVNRLKN